MSLTKKEQRRRWRETNRRYRARHPLRVAERRKRWRLAAIAVLGGSCVRCGFIDERALQIDHIYGGGRQERLSKGWWRILKDIVENGPQEKYQLLCANCNAIKRLENKEHGPGAAIRP